MNLRKLRLWLLLFTLTPLAAAQFTLVSGTVTDPSGLPYANGTITPTLISSDSPTLSGIAYTPPTQPVGLSQVGGFAMQLADNTQLSPGGSQWRFLVCSAAGTVQPSGGKGPVCFAATLTISGTSQDISASLHTAAPSLTAGAGLIFSSAVTGVSMVTSGSNTILVGPVTMTMPSTSGTYRFVVQLIDTAAGSGGTCNSGTVNFNLSYKEADTGNIYSPTTTPNVWSLTHNTNAAANSQTFSSGAPSSANSFYSIPIELRAAGGTPIIYQVIQQANSNCTTPPVFTVRPSLYYLGY